MAVRNLKAISRHGKMLADQQANERKIRHDSFWSRVDTIRSCRNDAVDFVETVEAMRKNGMRNEFEKWLKNQNLSYTTTFGNKIQLGNSTSGKVYYSPEDDDVCFGWQDGWMSEYYSVNRGQADYIVDTRFRFRSEYDRLLTLMAERLRPFLDAFFEWVDSL